MHGGSITSLVIDATVERSRPRLRRSAGRPGIHRPGSVG